MCGEVAYSQVVFPQWLAILLLPSQLNRIPHSMSGRRLDPTVFVDVCFLEVLPQIGRVMNVAEDTVTNLAMDPPPFSLVWFQNFAISSRKTKKLPNSTNSSLECRNSSTESAHALLLVTILARSNAHECNIVVVIAVIDITMFTNNRD